MGRRMTPFLAKRRQTPKNVSAVVVMPSRVPPTLLKTDQGYRICAGLINKQKIKNESVRIAYGFAWRCV